MRQRPTEMCLGKRSGKRKERGRGEEALERKV
jgi:hypothetical protein